MKTTRPGRTGLDVSRICLGCMTDGVPEFTRREMLPLGRDHGVEVLGKQAAQRGVPRPHPVVGHPVVGFE